MMKFLRPVYGASVLSVLISTERPCYGQVPGIAVTDGASPAGYTISWPGTAMTTAVEATTNLAVPTWTPLATNSGNPRAASFSDTQSSNYPARFYRVSFRKTEGTSHLWALPPMGIEPWLNFGPNGNEADYRRMIDQLYANGLTALGWRWIDVTDGWQGPSRVRGHLVADAVKFPSGLAALTAYAHAHNCLMMIYTEPWNMTSSGHIGSAGHLEQDATDFIAWGFDALRFDIPEGYSPGVNFAHAQVTAQMSQYLKAAAGHAVPISSSAWWPQDDLGWAPLVSNSFQDTAGLYDLTDLGTGRRVVLWTNFLGTLARTTSVPWLSGPGHYHTIDWMPTSYGTVFPTMYALMSSPLWAGDTVVPWANPGALRIFKNQDFIGVDQDPLGSPATLVAASGNSQVWLKRLANGDRAVGFLNTSTTVTSKIGATAVQLGFLPNQTVYFKSVWAQTKGKFIGSYSTTVPPMDAGFYVMSGSPLVE